MTIPSGNPSNIKKKPKTQIHPMRNEMAPQTVWARSDEENQQYSQNIQFIHHMMNLMIMKKKDNYLKTVALYQR
jgi:hypothetical protein